MILKKINSNFYLLSTQSFDERLDKGTPYYDGEGDVRAWGTGSSYSLSSKNIIASTKDFTGILKIDKFNLYLALKGIDLNKELNDRFPDESEGMSHGGLSNNMRKTYTDRLKITADYASVGIDYSKEFAELAWPVDSNEVNFYRSIWTNGYNKAAEHKKLFSMEDMHKMMIMTLRVGLELTKDSALNEEFENSTCDALLKREFGKTEWKAVVNIETEVIDVKKHGSDLQLKTSIVVDKNNCINILSLK